MLSRLVTTMVFLMIVNGCTQVPPTMQTSMTPDIPDTLTSDLAKAELFIDAFYSFDQDRLRPLLEAASESAISIMYYQGWAEGGNYKVVERGACVADSNHAISCPITVQDDPVLALKTGFNVTDTFALRFVDGQIVSVETSSNDQPVYFEARKWVEREMPEVMAGPCKTPQNGGTTPGDCARAMTEGYRRFAESDEGVGSK
jgi:hypothetical protein